MVSTGKGIQLKQDFKKGPHNDTMIVRTEASCVLILSTITNVKKRQGYTFSILSRYDEKIVNFK